MFGFLKKKKFEPIAIENELGKFKMRYMNKEPCYEYSGTCVWNGIEKEILAFVPCDSKKTFCADEGFTRLAEVVASSADWDARLREYALDFAVETYGLENGLIEIWGSWDPDAEDDDGEPVTPEEFSKRISITSVEVRENGSLEFDVDLDDMFTDHCLMIWADKDGNLTDSGLQG